jgi:hypothetical protein
VSNRILAAGETFRKKNSANKKLDKAQEVSTLKNANKMSKPKNKQSNNAKEKKLTKGPKKSFKKLMEKSWSIGWVREEGDAYNSYQLNEQGQPIQDAQKTPQKAQTSNTTAKKRDLQSVQPKPKTTFTPDAANLSFYSNGGFETYNAAGKI